MSSVTIEGWYQRYFPLIREKCRRMLGDSDEAQDLAQDTFIRLWQAGVPLGNARTVTAWVYKTATRLAVDRIRAHAVRQRLPAQDEVDLGPFGIVAARRQVQSLAHELPPEELSAALLARVDGLSHVECAEVLGVSERTVRRLLERFDARVTMTPELA